MPIIDVKNQMRNRNYYLICPGFLCLYYLLMSKKLLGCWNAFNFVTIHGLLNNKEHSFIREFDILIFIINFLLGFFLWAVSDLNIITVRLTFFCSHASCMCFPKIR